MPAVRGMGLGVLDDGAGWDGGNGSADHSGSGIEDDAAPAKAMDLVPVGARRHLVEPRVGIEPTTYALRVRCSTD